MKRLLFLSLLAIVSVSLVVPAGAATSTNVSGHWKESYPKSGAPNCFTGSPCGIGNLSPYGSAAETFVFGGSDGFDANGCEKAHGTTTITLADSSRSSFEALEHDTSCHPGESLTAPGRPHSYSSPYTFTGTWTFVRDTGTGVFSNLCAGSGDTGGNFAGSTGIVHYAGTLTFSC